MRSWVKAIGLFAVALVCWGLTGCSQFPSAGAVSPQQQPRFERVAIVVSSRASIFVDVANSVKQRLGSKATVIYLDRDSESRARLAQEIQVGKGLQVVAVGLPAAMWSLQLDQKRVVFCQVFNYHEAGLINSYRKGIQSVPPPGQLFEHWKNLSPKLKSVIVMTGPNHEKFISWARVEAHQVGIRLDHVVVRSDKDLLYTYKNRARKYQGVWLLPDNRVLSRTAMREVMSYSVRHGKQVAVFSPQLLQIGGLISAEPEPDDVAVQVVKRLQAVGKDAAIPGPAMLELTRTRFQYNRVVAKQLGLNISQMD